MSFRHVIIGKDVSKHLQDIINVLRNPLSLCALSIYVLQRIVELCIIPLFEECVSERLCRNDDSRINTFYNEIARRTFYIRFECNNQIIYFGITISLDSNNNYTIVTFYPITRYNDENFQQRTKLRRAIDLVCNISNHRLHLYSHFCNYSLDFSSY